MSNLPPSPASAPPGPPGPSDASTQPDNPLARLHKMSITAGLGSGDYVAINPRAVATLILALGSFVALFHPILLLVPAAGVVCAVVSLVQIGRSNGTQGGRGLAWIGLLGCLGCGGLFAGRQAVQYFQDHAAQEQIVPLMGKLDQCVRTGRFDQAYALFTAEFQQRVTRELFQQRMGELQNSPMYGTMGSMAWNGQMRFFNDTLSGDRCAMTMLVLQFNKTPEPIRQEMIFQHQEGTWRIENIPFLFPLPRK